MIVLIFFCDISAVFVSLFCFSAKFRHSDTEEVNATSNNKVHNEMDGENTQELVNILKTVNGASELSR
jgi:hypothetical protein